MQFVAVIFHGCLASFIKKNWNIFHSYWLSQKTYFQEKGGKKRHQEINDFRYVATGDQTQIYLQISSVSTN